MNEFAKELAKGLVISTVSTIGLITGVTIWAGGLNEVVNNGVNKVFKKNQK
jgi:hypothetical protein